MKTRNPVAVFFLSLITFGIYAIVWSVKTKDEMNKLGSDIPTAWLLIIPFVSLYWTWKYSEGVEKVTGGKMSAVMSFVLLVLLGVIGMAILQNEFNKLAVAPPSQTPQPSTDGFMPPAGPNNGAMPPPSPQGFQPTGPIETPSPLPPTEPQVQVGEDQPPLPPQSPPNPPTSIPSV